MAVSSQLIYFIPNLNKYISLLFQLLIFFKFHIINDILKKLDYIFGYKEAYVNVFEFVKVVLYIFLSAHVMNLLYYLVAVIEMNYYDNDNTWL